MKLITTILFHFLMQLITAQKVATIRGLVTDVKW